MSMENSDFSTVFREIGGFVPHLLSAVSILILGWLGAWIVRALLERGLRGVHLDERLTRWGLNRLFSAPSGRPLSATRTLGTLTYFTLMLFVLIAFFDSLELTDLTAPINRLHGDENSHLWCEGDHESNSRSSASRGHIIDSHCECSNLSS